MLQKCEDNDPRRGHEGSPLQDVRLVADSRADSGKDRVQVVTTVRTTYQSRWTCTACVTELRDQNA
jgi:hypothetical protein